MMYKLFKKSLLIIASFSIICVMVFCKNIEKPKPKTIAKKPVINDTLRINNKLNDIALFIAGLNVSDSSKLSKLTNNPEWKKYQTNIDTNWAKLEKRRMSKIKEWSIKEMADINKSSKTIFYPFSGADFIHVYNFFPDAEKYILIGLEHPGTIPEFKSNVKSDYLKLYFYSISRSIEDLLRMSFFRTSDMSYDMNNKYVTGTLPIMMLFMARSHNEIISIKPITLNTKGEIVYLDSIKIYKGKDNYNKGIEIKFKDSETKTLKTVIYLCADISDKGLKLNNTFNQFLSNLDFNVTTYIKSASYLMHFGDFNTTMNVILTHTKYLLQDDSGVPMRFLKSDYWDIKYYGKYEKPIDSFKKFYQPELKTAFDNANQISFKVGYGYISHQILARRKS